MGVTFCKLPLNFGDLLSEDVENCRLNSCSEKDSIDQYLNLLISTSPGELAYDKSFGCEIFSLDFERITSRTRWEGQFTEYIKDAIVKNEKRLINVDVKVHIDDKVRQDTVFETSTIKKRTQIYVTANLVHTGEKCCFYYVLYLGPISTK